MNQDEIASLIKHYETELAKLFPTLHPGSKGIPYTKIGLLNTARRKEKKYTHNINMLQIVKKGGREYPDELIKDLLQ